MTARANPTLSPAPRDQVLLRLRPGERSDLLRRAARAQIELGQEMNLQRYIRSVLFPARMRRKDGTYAPTPPHINGGAGG